MASRSRTLLTLLALTLGPAARGQDAAGPRALQLRALDSVATIDGEGYRAWATPVGRDRWVTSKHSVTGPMSVAGRAAKVVWRAPEADLAVIEAPAATWLPVAARLPEAGEEVYFRAFLPGPGEVPTKVRGWWLGVDGAGVAYIDAWGSVGSSGSGVVNAAGELVAVVSRGQNPMVTYEEKGADPVRALSNRSHARPTVLASPVAGLAEMTRITATGGAAGRGRKKRRPTERYRASGASSPITANPAQ
jgi:hypothetical protein